MGQQSNNGIIRQVHGFVKYQSVVLVYSRTSLVNALFFFPFILTTAIVPELFMRNKVNRV